MGYSFRRRVVETGENYPTGWQADVSLLTPHSLFCVATDTINPPSRQIQKAFPSHSGLGGAAEKPGACSFHSEGRSADLLSELFNRSVPARLTPIEGARRTNH